MPEDGIELLPHLRNSLQKATQEWLENQRQYLKVIPLGVVGDRNGLRFAGLGAPGTLADGLHLGISNC